MSQGLKYKMMPLSGVIASLPMQPALRSGLCKTGVITGLPPKVIMRTVMPHAWSEGAHSVKVIC